MTNNYTKLTYKGNIYSDNNVNGIQALLDIKNPRIGDMYSISMNDKSAIWDKHELYIYNGTDWILFNRCYASASNVLKMKNQEETLKNISKIQDGYLIELNQIAGIPDLTFYKDNRQCVYVDEATMKRMKKRAYDYQEFIRNVREKTINKNQVYNERWLFDVIEKYYKVQR